MTGGALESQGTPAPVTIEKARGDEDTHQWIARLHRENAAKAAQQTTAGRRNVSVVEFLRSWMNDPMPHHVIEAGAEVVEMDDYTPEKRAHQIVKRCVIAWMEAADGERS
jgi:hypothetical protein